MPAKALTVVVRELAVVAVVLAVLAPAGPAAPGHGGEPAQTRHKPARAKTSTRRWTIRYLAHDRTPRRAYVLLPAWYGPRRHPPIPLIISPHGRGVGARANAALWDGLPGRGGFAVISPDGEGRRLGLYSWGSVGQINDLARMPQIARLTLPWLRVDRHRIYAFGGSMGGQETLLLLARHPRLLAGAAAFDAVTNLARQYRNFPRIPCRTRCRRLTRGRLGRSLQTLARDEVGGTPRTRPSAYAERSPATYARRIAASCVPLQLWWSVKDRVVRDQQHQSAALYRRIRTLNPHAPVQAFVGYWAHSAEMRASSRLPVALALFGLLPSVAPDRLVGMHRLSAASVGDGRAACRRPR